jgi:acyl-CoA reductase-like NAD-dependent aldehyde dehydrogenase
LLDQEIFGPLLPIRTAGSIADAVRDASSRPTPLAMYLFSRDRAARRLAHMRARCGVLVINGVMDAATATRLPFGGVGTSGMGRYHGKAGFDAFSWSRAVIERRLWPELGFVYPPYRTPPRLIRAAMRVLLRS